MRRRALALSLAVTACGNGEPLGRAERFIDGGARDSDDAAVVAVVNFAGGQCSGSLIAPGLVLTARHCVADTEGKELQVECGKTTFEPADSAGALFVVPLAEISEDPDDYLAVSEIRLPEALGDDLCGTDVALLRLAAPLAGVTPLEPRLDQPATPGERYASVGFGTDAAAQQSGQRKRLDGLEVECAGEACRRRDVRENEWIGSRGVCSGDSGGPALDEQGRVIGVVSRGARSCASPVFGDVVSRAAWLRSEARRASSESQQAPPAWAGCDSSEDCVSAQPQSGAPAETCSFTRGRAPAAFGWASAWVGLLALLRRGRFGALRRSR